MMPEITSTEPKRETIGLPIRLAVKQFYLGWVAVAVTDRGICAIEFGDRAEELMTQVQNRFANAQFQAADADFDTWVDQVIAFVETPQQELNLPLDIQGTAFQQRVWSILQTIPAGSTATYTEVAQCLGNPKAVRAVARACASNQIAVAIPCHRVIGSKGALTGYRWGLERKQALLARESSS